MALVYSTGFKDAVLDTGSFKSTFEAGGGGGYIKIYDGAVPADADAALGGATELVVYSDNDAGEGAGLGLDLEAAAVDGAISKLASQIWKGTCGATGTAAFFRFELLADDGLLSTTQVRIQGIVGGAGADLFVSSTAFTNTTVYTLDLFSISVP